MTAEGQAHRTRTETFEAPSAFITVVRSALSSLEDLKVFTMRDWEGLVDLVAPDRPRLAFDSATELIAAVSVDDQPALIVPPWGRSRERSAEDAWLRLPPISRDFGIICAATELRHEWPRRYGHLGVPRLVVDGQPRLPGANSRLVAALVLCEPESLGELAATKFFTVPEATRPAEVLGDFERLLRQGGGSTDHGFVLRGESLAGKPLTGPLYDPVLRGKEKDLAGFGSGALVNEVFEVLRPRPVRPGPAGDRASVEPVEQLEPDTWVVTARDVTVAGDLIPRDKEEESADFDAPHRPPARVQWRNVQLRPGDLLLREIERADRPGTPAMITDSDLPAAAGRSLLVLRPRAELDPEEVEFYRTYLGTAVSRELMRSSRLAGSHQLNAVHRLRLPRPDRDLLDALCDIRRARETLRSWADSQAGVTRATFTGSASEARHDLISASRELRQRAEAATQVGSLDHRVATFYPYPVAYKWRTVRAAESLDDLAQRYAAILDCFESIMAFTASLAMIFARYADIDIGAMQEIRRKLGRDCSGVALGDWVNVLKEVAGPSFRGVGSDAPLAAIRQMLPQGSSVARAQERLAARRNDESHGRRVDALRLPDAVRDATTDLEAILDHAGFISDIHVVQVKDSQWDTFTQTGTATVQPLRGDHPVTPATQLAYRQPDLERGSLYAKDEAGNLVLLRPYLIREACPECGAWSTFHPDHFSDGRLKLKAMDHRHTTSDGDKHIDAMRAVGYLPPQ